MRVCFHGIRIFVLTDADSFLMLSVVRAAFSISW